ncbi:hypothetical protein [Streptomyces sp. NPDC093060]|uniref:hypothetical protein n=1 Tax=Streptomyces sp. NPDC093060 TaxID=3366019 RepID=UPI003826B9B6
MACRRVLHIATGRPGHYPGGSHTVTALVAAGADELHRPAPRDPLHWAAGNDDVPVLDALLDLGADIEADGGVIGGGTPIAGAVAARRLLDRGARTSLWQGRPRCSRPRHRPFPAPGRAAAPRGDHQRAVACPQRWDNSRSPPTCWSKAVNSTGSATAG